MVLGENSFWFRFRSAIQFLPLWSMDDKAEAEPKTVLGTKYYHYYCWQGTPPDDQKLHPSRTRWGGGRLRPLGPTTGFTILTYWQRKLTQTCSTYIFVMFYHQNNFLSTLLRFKHRDERVRLWQLKLSKVVNSQIWSLDIHKWSVSVVSDSPWMFLFVGMHVTSRLSFPSCLPWFRFRPPSRHYHVREGTWTGSLLCAWYRTLTIGQVSIDYCFIE